nr:serine/threonine-protein phosphatase 6 regulatory ankyrin repeat subunit A-like [Hydra vulgaris]
MSSSLLQYLEDLKDEENSSDTSSSKSTTFTSINKSIRQFASPISVNKQTDSKVLKKSDVTDNEPIEAQQLENYLPVDNYDDHGMTPLMQACRDDNTTEVDKLIKAGINIDEIDADGRTALFYSITFSSITIVQTLLSANADPFIVAGLYERNCLHQACKRAKNAVEVVRLLLQIMGDETKLEQDKAGFIALHLAVSTGKQDVCRELLSTHSKEQLHAITRDYGDTALHLAARRKELNIIRLLVQAEANINQVNLEGQTPLHIAVAESDVDSVEYLINENASGIIKDKKYRNALHIATEIGNMDIIELLIEKCHIDINELSKDGSTLVHLAAKSGHVQAMIYFIQKGIAVKTPNKEGAEALHEACKQGHLGVVRKLIANGAKIERCTKDNYTPLHIAVRYGKYDVVQLLIGAGANVNALGGPENECSLHFAAKLKRNSEKITDLLLKRGAIVDITDFNGETALHAAIRVINYPVVKMLVEEGASITKTNLAGETSVHLSVSSMSVASLLISIDEIKKNTSHEMFCFYLNSRNKLGETPLHYCANITPKIENQAIYTDLIRLLLDNYAEVSIPTFETKETPVHYCCRNGNTDILRMIFESMSEKEASKAANFKNSDGWTPLLVACYYGYHNILRILLDNDARVDLFDENGKAALHVACENGHILCVNLIMEKRAYVNAKTKLGMTPVSLAASNNHCQLIEILVNKYMASYDIQSLIKRSALHVASERGHIEACKILIHLGADPMLADINQAAPIHLAAENNHPDVVKMFLDVRPDLSYFINKDGNNCAHIAAAKGSLEVLKALIKVNSTMSFSKSKTTLRTPLHLAAIHDHVDIIQLLINQGVSLLEEDKDGLTPLHLAAKFGARNAIELFKGKISFNVFSSKTGMNPLHLAAEFDQAECLVELMSKVPPSIASECPAGKIPAETEHGLTCLHYAAKNGHEVTLRQLLNSDGVIVEHPTSKKGLLSIHMAIAEGHANVTSILLSRSAEQINARCAIGRTALHFAAGNKHLELVQLLLGQGAEIDAQDKNGWTPLHYAADAGSTDIVIFLVQMGAQPSIEDMDGKAPITFAAKHHHLQTMSFLLLHKFEVNTLLQDNKFLGHLMICCNLNDNESAQDFILNSPAPIYTAMKLTLMYRQESIRVKDKSEDYMKIAEYCEQMTYEILHVASTYGCESLLNAVDDLQKPLLDVLIDEEFKLCVAHNNVQSYLSNLWKGSGMSIEGVYAILFTVVCFLCPPFWFFLCLPFHRWNKVPTIKFICHVISHLYYITVLIYIVVVPWDRSKVETFPTYAEYILVIWVSGHLLAEITEPESQPFRIFTLFLMSAAFGTHIVALFMSATTREEILYGRDNILGVALVMLISQILLFLSLNKIFGPWSVMIENLVIDVCKFLVIMFLFIFAFTMHTAVVFKRVYGLTETDVTLTTAPFADRYDQNGFWDMFYDKFFGLFGFTEPPATLSPSEQATNPRSTYIIGTISFAMYQILAIIVLLNMLIAMMSNTYTRLDEQSDIEWKYGRAGIIRLMTKSYSIPIPANVLAALCSIVYVCIIHNGCCCLKSWKSRFKSISKEDQSIPKENQENLQSTIWDVVNWSIIIDEYMLNNGIEDRFAKIKKAAAAMSDEILKVQSSTN